MKVKPVIEHTCRLQRGSILTESQLIPGNRYILIEEGKDPLYRLLPKCKCRKYITSAEADDAVSGKNKAAVNVFRLKNRVVEIDFKAIWLVQKPRVPRVDLITKAHIERAYVDKDFIDIEYIEEVHRMHMEERLKWLVPYQEDPRNDPDSTALDRVVSGRILDPFPADQRTKGGISGR